MNDFDCLILGNGILGASLAYYLSKQDLSVCVIGASYGFQQHYFSSHQDISRMYRQYDDSLFWSNHAAKSYSEIKALENIAQRKILMEMPVYYRALNMGDITDTQAGRPVSVGKGLTSTWIESEHRDVRGGVINPLALIESLNSVSRSAGVRFLEGSAIPVGHSIAQSGNLYKVIYDGAEIEASLILDARGVYNVLPSDPVDVVGKVFYFANIDKSIEPHCFIEQLDHPDYSDAYGFSNVSAEPDQAGVLKLGLSEKSPHVLANEKAVGQWFTQGYQMYSQAQQFLQDRYGVSIVGTRPCSFSISNDGQLQVNKDGNLVRFSACNGKGAKSFLSVAKDFVSERSWLC